MTYSIIQFKKRGNKSKWLFLISEDFSDVIVQIAGADIFYIPEKITHCEIIDNNLIYIDKNGHKVSCENIRRDVLTPDQKLKAVEIFKKITLNLEKNLNKFAECQR